MHPTRAQTSVHAAAVRQAIAVARRDQAEWDRTDAMRNAPTTTTTGAHVAGHGLANVGIKLHSITPYEVLVGMRVAGNQLLLIDEDRNKTSAPVRALDGLLTKARDLASANPKQRIDLATSVDGTPNNVMTLAAMPTTKECEEEKGLFDVEVYWNHDGERHYIEPIGVLSWKLP